MWFFLFVVAIVASLSVIALALEKRRPDPPAQVPYETPAMLDRNDFDHPDTKILVAFFSSGTCDSCDDVRPKVMAMQTSSVAVQEVSFQSDKLLHERYDISAVPMVCVCNQDGLVLKTFIGAMPAADLWQAIPDVKSQPSVAVGDPTQAAIGSFE